MSEQGRREAIAAEAARRVDAVRDDPRGRLALADDAYIHASDGRLAPYARAEIAFIEWLARRGVLDPADEDGSRGSEWWRTVNARLLCDCEEASLLYAEGLFEEGSNPVVHQWMRFFLSPSPESWYRAHNASIVAGYLDAEEHARHEGIAEQVLMNIVLGRALYAYQMVAGKGRLGLLSRLGRWLADPSGRGLEMMIDLPDFYPADHPMSFEDQCELLGLGFSPQALINRVIDWLYEVEPLYAWNAERIEMPELLELQRDGVPCYPAREMRVRIDRPEDERAVGEDLDRHFDAVASGAIEDVEPAGIPWQIGISLRDLCFVSWELPPDVVRRLIPDQLELDLYEGRCYMTAISMWAEQIHIRGRSFLPKLFRYHELNVRTYVRHEGVPGIWFFSIDAEPGGLFSLLAETFLNVPYSGAEMGMDPDPGRTRFWSERDGGGGSFDLVYAMQDGTAADPADGTFERFICVRDLAFSMRGDEVWRFEVRHPSWPVQPATVERVAADDIFTSVGLPVPTSAPLACASPGSDGIMLPPVPA